MKKIKNLFLLGLLVLIPAIIIGCNPKGAQYRVANAYLTIDINPSIEIITGEDGLVASVTPLNADAETLMVDVDLVGMTVDNATEKIVNIAIEMGYIDFNSENAIIITAEAGEETENLKKTLAEKVNDFVKSRKMNIEVLKASFEASTDMKELAESLGISIGKLKLITVAMANNPNLTVEKASQMSVKDINRIIIDARKEVHEFYRVEFQAKYQEQKIDLYLNYQQNRTTLLNDVIQNNDLIAISELNLTEEQVLEVKALYQEYSDELTAIDIDSYIEARDAKNADFEETIAELNKIKDELREELTNELGNMMNHHRFHKGSRAMMQEKIKGIRDKINNVNDLIKNCHDEFQVEGKFHWNLKNHHHIYKPFNPIKEVQKEYEKLFEDLNIDLEDFEEIFEVHIETELNTLKEEYSQTIEDLKLEYIDLALTIKQQLIDEKQALINIWRKK